MPIHITDYLEEKSSGIKKKDLRKTPNLKQIFISINQHLYGKLKYTDTDTRSRSKQIINLLLCKLVDEINKELEEEVDFCIRNGESADELYSRIQSFFTKNVREKYKDILEENEQITLNKGLISLIVKELQNISLLQSSRDILSDAFEIFVSKILKDEAGQFFTPQNIIKFIVNYLGPTINSKILDPACGHGGFLLETKEVLWSKIESDQKRIESISNLFGIDKDLFLAKISKLYLEILSNGKSNIFCEDSLDPHSYRTKAKKLIQNNTFDYILTNPPFGVKIPINDEKILINYQLGHVWKNQAERWEIQNRLVKQQAPQVLFIERCVQLLKNGGKLGIVLPEGIFGNPTDRYIWQYLTSQGKILGIVSLDQNAFQPYTCNKTSILFFEKLENIPEDYVIDFAIIENVGHDKDGKVLYKLNKDGSKKIDTAGNFLINDDLADLNLKIKNAEAFNYLKEQKIFKIMFSKIKNNIFIPIYYTGVEKTLQKLANDNNYTLITFKDLIEKKIIYTNKGGYLPRGDEIGSHLYGLGDIPFIRTSELNNWEINLDSYKKTSREVYEQYKLKQNIEEGDILLVKDGGPNLIGKTAYITSLDTKIIIQSHIFQIKTLKNDEFIDSYLILYLLNLDIVQKQIQAITFVQGTIATIGNRIMELVLPIPVDYNKRKEISNYIKNIIKSKIEIRNKIKKVSSDFSKLN
ncbi:MAG: N-6 DNA methylase [Promethearchaeota archaeon]|nr:MAG: N-6 DNA methylase [Candidatus Lokiarchaeota archaeon]